MRMAMIGFGEAAEALATGWGTARAAGLAGYDIRQTEPHAKPLARAAAAGVTLAPDRAAALDRAEAVWCLVTADRAVEAARQCAPHLPAGCLWLDANSCSPGGKRVSAEVIEAAGGRYVDVAIMAPVHPRLHRTPMLIAGPHAAAAAGLLSDLGMSAEIAGDAVGDASAVKMIRSVMIKGIEALTAECVLAARRAGVDGRVLGSLVVSDPGTDWPRRAAYNLERMMVHGGRRAAEMREVAATLDELGMPSDLATATAQWQDRIGELALPAGPDDLAARSDAILARLAGRDDQP